MKKLVRFFIIRLYYLFVKFTSVNKRVILFESNLGRNYSGNPKYIYEELVRQGLDKEYKCIWIFEDPKVTVPGNCQKIKRARFKYIYYMAIAKIWVFDCRQPKYLIKRKECAYIQTWHGTPLKKLALDMKAINMAHGTDIRKYHADFYTNTRTWDYLISQNNYSTNIFRKAFAFERTMLEIGYPRNDVLVNNANPEITGALKTKFQLPLEKKVILYAPTWRDNEYYGMGKYKFNLKLDLARLKAELQEEYVIVLKLHYLISDNLDLEAYQGFAYLVPSNSDIQELYLVADMLITDYSSVMFDYSLLKRPMLFFTYDLKEYQTEIRDFYFNFLEEAPGPVVQDNNELVRAIENLRTDFGTYAERFEKFRKKFNHADDGTASGKVVELIKQLTK